MQGEYDVVVARSAKTDVANKKRYILENRPNQTTLAAMAEAERLANDPNTKRYHDVDEALAELKR